MSNEQFPERKLIVHGQMAYIEQTRPCPNAENIVYCTDEAECEYCEIRKIRKAIEAKLNEDSLS